MLTSGSCRVRSLGETDRRWLWHMTKRPGMTANETELTSAACRCVAGLAIRAFVSAEALTDHFPLP